MDRNRASRKRYFPFNCKCIGSSVGVMKSTNTSRCLRLYINIVFCCVFILLRWKFTNNEYRLPTDCVSIGKDRSFELAYNHSYGYFHDIPDSKWEQYYQKPALLAQHYRYPDDQNRYTYNRSEAWIFSNWDPYFTCPHVRKIGGLGGGSKWICDIERLRRVIEQRRRQPLTQQIPNADFWSPPASFVTKAINSTLSNDKNIYKSHCLVYSIGSNGNYIWEDALFREVGKECEIHIFDPDPFNRPDMLEKKNMHFHQWGLGSSYSKVWMNRKTRVRKPKRSNRKNVRIVPNRTYYSFQEIRKRLGHENCTIDLFKIDCEGCEWHTYKDWINSDLRQILIETHELPIQHYEKRTVFGILPRVSASEVFETFYNNGFVLFFKEVNTMKGNGYSSEWSFLKLHSDFFQRQLA